MEGERRDIGSGETCFRILLPTGELHIPAYFQLTAQRKEQVPVVTISEKTGTVGFFEFRQI